MKKKIIIQHLSCGNIFEPIAYEFIKNGTRCPTCSRKKLSLGMREFKKRVNELTNGEYIVIGCYVNNRKKVDMIHKKCNQSFSPVPSSFLAGTRCPYCSGRRSNIETFKKELFNLVGSEYVLSGDYRNKNTKVKLLHSACGNYYNVSPVNFIKSGYRCPKCVHKNLGLARRKQNNNFVEELKQKYNGQIEPLDEYLGAHNKIRFRHLLCGEIFTAKPNGLLTNNASCPKCSRSGPETIIEGILISNNIKFIREFRFLDCLGKWNTKLPFDFAIFDEQEKLTALIEYDGEQHYKPSFGIENYKRTILNDNIKNNYCEQRNIQLLRIPYWKLQQSEGIIKQFLKIL